MDSQGQAGTVLARIPSNIERLHQDSSVPYRISLSIEIVHCNPFPDLTLSDHYSLADRQMYAQKKARNKRSIDDWQQKSAQLPITRAEIGKSNVQRRECLIASTYADWRMDRVANTFRSMLAGLRLRTRM